MHESKHFSRLPLGYTFDYSSPQAKCTMSLVEHYLTCTFDLANTNKFDFYGQTLGLNPNETVQVIMTLYDPSTCYEVEDHIDICPSADINTQLLSNLIGQMERLQPGTSHRQLYHLIDQPSMPCH